MGKNEIETRRLLIGSYTGINVARIGRKVSESSSKKKNSPVWDTNRHFLSEVTYLREIYISYNNVMCEKEFGKMP